MSTPAKEYWSFRVPALPASKFGETYVITTLFVDPAGVRRAEAFVLSKRQDPRLVISSVVPPPPGDPVELPDEYQISDEQLRDEAKQVAINVLEDAIYRLAEEVGDDAIASKYRVELNEVSYMALMGPWMRHEMRDEIRAIAGATQCPSLRLYLGILTRSAVVWRS